MPRGVAIPELRQQLFAALERVIARDGPARLSGRAVTGEAKVATGLLYAHFADFDDFLTGYTVDRSFMVSAGAAVLSGRVGTGGVVDNLCDALVSTPPTSLRALVKVLVCRPELADRTRAVLGDEAAGLEAIENAVAAYLVAEQRIGRVVAAARPEPLTLALVGALQHLLLTTTAEPDIPTRLSCTVTALIENLTSASTAIH